MPDEFKPIDTIDDVPKYSFNFGLALTAAVPRYADASLTALIANVDAYCTSVERDVALALLDGMSLHAIAELFDLKQRQVVLILENSIQTINDAVNPLADVTKYEPSDPYDTITTDSTPAQSETGDWRDEAACLYTDPELFFNEDAVSRAKAVCEPCLAKAACLQYALDTDESFGVWGGLTTEERERLKS